MCVEKVSEERFSDKKIKLLKSVQSMKGVDILKGEGLLTKAKYKIPDKFTWGSQAP
jgi:hypothetical protein